MLKTYQIETTFSQDKKKKESKTGENDVNFAMTALRWFCYDDFIAIVFAFPVRLCLQAKLPTFFKTGYTGKYRRLIAKDV